MAFRYIERDDMDFKEGFRHENIKPVPESEKTLVWTSKDISNAIQKVFDSLKGKKLGIMLSGGMDSACLASYMRGCDAYTFRFVGANDIQNEELHRAETYAKYYGLNLHYVDINWEVANANLTEIMRAKSAPVHSIEPQIYAAALQAKADGVEQMIVGESSDLIFGGMDQLISREWTFEDFKNRYIFTKPEDVLVEPVDMTYLFERYRKDGDMIDYMTFMDDVFSIESSSSYLNAFYLAGLNYTDPYAKLKMAEPLDLNRVRNGEPKYLIRDLFAMKYPGVPIPFKVPMPRPVDYYFKDWTGPKRPEFRTDIDLNKYTGNQKWQMYCLERFLEEFFD
ncbi:MAG: asparagine synthase [Bacteroidaceae bacterium]|nr:asparagine synthase [Bacteroidaceae bacterium]